MNMLLVVSMTDSVKSDIKDDIARISEIDELICKLNDEKIAVAEDLTYKCNLLNAVVKDEEFKERVDDSVITKHKSLAANGSAIASKILQNKGN